MWLLLEKIFAFTLLVATFIYIRSFAAVLRSLYPKSVTNKIGLRLTALLFVLPSFFVGLGLYVLYYRFGVVWISTTGIWLSWGQDLFYLLGMIYYYSVLRRIELQPASFELLIRLQDHASFPSSDVVRKPLDYLLFRLPIGKRWKKTTVLVKPADFRRFLKNDLRLIDEVDQPALLLAEHGNINSVPHFPVSIIQAGNFGNWRETEEEKKDEPPTKKSQIKTENARYHIINRALHSQINEETWNTSRLICDTPPFIIARTWKTFHFQESVRLRLVALFNTSDLIQRLTGAIILSILRDKGIFPTTTSTGEPFRLPETSSHWIKTLQDILQNTSTPELECFRQALLQPRQDYLEWQQRLSPFSMVLGNPILFSPQKCDALAGWRDLGILRNKIIGHGGVGAHIQLRPIVYLSALHYFFLATMRDVVSLNLSIFIGTESDGLQIISKDQGFSSSKPIAANCLAYYRQAENKNLTCLFPYIRYHEGRMLIMNKLTKNGINYIDYNSANVFEPSFITLDADWNDFILPKI